MDINDGAAANSSFTSKILSNMAKFSNSEKKVAEWIVRNPERICDMSMIEIANQAGVSDATVLRFCRKSGFKGFFDLKISSIREDSDSSKLVYQGVTPEDSTEKIAKKVFQSNIKALEDTISVMDFKAFDKAVRFIQKSNHILMIGVGTSGPIIKDMYNKFLRLGVSCKAESDSYLQLMEVSLMEKDDLVIAVSQSGSSVDPVDTLREAKQIGANTVVITGNRYSPLTKYADVVLQSISSETRPETISSRIAQNSIVDALYVAVAMRNLDKSVENEKKIWKTILCKTV